MAGRVTVTVRRLSGATFNVAVAAEDTCWALKAAIAVETKVAATRQKLLVNDELISNGQSLAELTRGEEPLVVLLLVSPSCSLVTHYSCRGVGIWDSDARTMDRPLLVKGEDARFHSAYDAMRLEDGLYTLAKCGNIGTGLYYIQLWRGVPGAEVRRMHLKGWMLEESVEVQFSPDGAFVIASCMDKVFLWRTQTGEAHLQADGSEWTGSIGAVKGGRLLLLKSSSIFGPCTSSLWDYHAGTCTFTTTWEGDHSLYFELSNSGAWLAKWAYMQPLKLMATKDDAGEVRQFTEEPVEKVGFSQDEKQVLVVYQDWRQLGVIRISDGLTRVVDVPEGGRFLQSPCFSADASILFVTEAGGGLHRWAASREGFELLAATPPPPKEIMTCDRCHDENTVFRCDREGRVELIELLTGSLLAFETTPAEAAT